MRKTTSVAARVVTVLALLNTASPSLAAEVPDSLAAFFGPKFTSPQLSPSGQYVGVVRAVDGHDFLEIFDLADSSSVNVLSMERGQGVSSYDWIDDEHVVYNVRRGSEFFGGRPSGSFRVQIIKRKFDPIRFERAPRPRLIFPSLRMPFQYYDYMLPQAFADSSEFRVTLSDQPKSDWGLALGAEETSYIYRHDIIKRRYKEIAKIPGEALSTYSDRDGNVLAAFGFPPVRSLSRLREEVQLTYRSDPEGEFKVARTGHRDDFEIYMIGDGPSPGTAYILEDATGDTLGLGILDLSNGEIASAFRAARTDVITSYLDGARQLYAVRHDDHFPQFHYPDPENPIARVHAALVEQFKDRNVEFVSIAADNSKAIVSVASDREPERFFVLDLKTNKLGGLFDSAPEEGKLELGPRNPIEFPARDGLRVTGYVTLPNGHTEGRLPVIVLLHDERFPEAHTWGYDSRAQLFASHGYAVLEVNPRGVVGFGREFYDAGVGERARGQLADIEDGVEFITSAGTADPDRVCIVGRNWGAQAAFMSAVRKRERYACVVTINGKYDVAAERRRQPMGGYRDRFTAQLAGPEATETDVDEMSPHLLAKRISTPLLLVEGKQGRQALGGEAHEMVRRLRDSEADWRIHEESTTRSNVLLDDHNRKTAYAAVLEFVATHLK